MKPIISDCTSTVSYDLNEKSWERIMINKNVVDANINKSLYNNRCIIVGKISWLKLQYFEFFSKLNSQWSF